MVSIENGVEVTHLCKDYFEHCHKPADPKYRMDYTDIGEGYIHWCSECGPVWLEVEKAITQRMDSEPGFTEKLMAEINKHTS